MASILEYSDTYEMTKRLDDDEKMSSKMDGISKTNPVVTLINESGLYHAILGNKKPGTVEFRRWVTGKVLPSLRKHEQYTWGQETMDDEELLAKALQRRG
ncbi:MAG: BRO family protein [Desulfobacterales bacterium]